MQSSKITYENPTLYVKQIDNAIKIQSQVIKHIEQQKGQNSIHVEKARQRLFYLEQLKKGDSHE